MQHSSTFCFFCCRTRTLKQAFLTQVCSLLFFIKIKQQFLISVLFLCYCLFAYHCASHFYCMMLVLSGIVPLPTARLDFSDIKKGKQKRIKVYRIKSDWINAMRLKPDLIPLLYRHAPCILLVSTVPRIKLHKEFLHCSF